MNPQIKHLEKEGIKVGSQVVYNGTIVEDYTNGFDDSWAGEDLEEGKIYIVKSINTESGSLKLKNTGYVYNHPISCFNVVSEDKKFPFFLHLEDAQKIIDCACSEWKKKLLEMWAKRLILNGKVEISEDFYKEMRNACNKEQHAIFDEIFGEDAKETRTLEEIMEECSLKLSKNFSLLTEAYKKVQIEDECNLSMYLPAANEEWSWAALEYTLEVAKYLKSQPEIRAAAISIKKKKHLNIEVFFHAN